LTRTRTIAPSALCFAGDVQLGGEALHGIGKIECQGCFNISAALRAYAGRATAPGATKHLAEYVTESFTARKVGIHSKPAAA
jgi:hypothetical protein